MVNGHYCYGYEVRMTTIAAGKFQDVCLKLLDEVARTRTPVVITKRGRPPIRPRPDALVKRVLQGKIR